MSLIEGLDLLGLIESRANGNPQGVDDQALAGGPAPIDRRLRRSAFRRNRVDGDLARSTRSQQLEGRSKDPLVRGDKPWPAPPAFLDHRSPDLGRDPLAHHVHVTCTT